MKKILIPVDFSDVSANAFMYGHRLATDMGAVTKAVHIYFPTSKDMREAFIVDVDFSELRKSYFSDFISKFDKDWGSDLVKTSLIDKEFRVGFPGEEILDSAEENAAEMIIMGTTGNSSRIKKWFGSVSTKVMSESSCPVLLVPEEAGYKGIKNILFAFNDIALDVDLLPRISEFARTFDANIHLVHVNSENYTDPGFYLEALLKEKYPKEKIITSSFYDENLVDGLEDYALKNNIDIIAMGTKNRDFLDKLFHESITEKMALHAKIPMLIFK